MLESKKVELTLEPGFLWAVDWDWAMKWLPRARSTDEFFHGVDGYFVKQEEDGASWMGRRDFERCYSRLHSDPMTLLRHRHDDDALQIGVAVTKLLKHHTGSEHNRWGGSIGVVADESWKCPRHGDIGSRILLAFIAGSEGPWCLQCVHESIAQAQVLRARPQGD